MVAYKAHNLVVGGSNPPAVTLKEVAPQRSPCSPLNLFQVTSQSYVGFDNLELLRKLSFNII